MKRALLFLFLTAATLGSQAQTFFNSSFESWTAGTGYDDPDGYSTSNALTFLGIPASVFKSTTAHSGTYSVECRSVAYTIFGSDDTISGFGANVGFPFTSRPLMTDGWYQLIAGSGSMHDASLVIFLTRWNTTLNAQDTVAVGMYGTSTTTGAVWTNFTAPLTYYSGLVPDTLWVVFALNGDAGAIMRLDDISFTGTVTGISETSTLVFGMYPNPATEEVCFTAFNDDVHRLEIISTTGNRVHTSTFTNTSNLPITEFPPGIYHIRITDTVSGQSEMKKLVIQH